MTMITPTVDFRLKLINVMFLPEWTTKTLSATWSDQSNNFLMKHILVVQFSHFSIHTFWCVQTYTLSGSFIVTLSMNWMESPLIPYATSPSPYRVEISFHEWKRNNSCVRNRVEKRNTNFNQLNWRRMIWSEKLLY